MIETNVKDAETKGWTEFFGISLDHKVVGIQFAVAVIFMVYALSLLACNAVFWARPAMPDSLPFEHETPAPWQT